VARPHAGCCAAACPCAPARRVCPAPLARAWRGLQQGEAGLQAACDRGGRVILHGSITRQHKGAQRCHFRVVSDDRVGDARGWSQLDRDLGHNRRTQWLLHLAWICAVLFRSGPPAEAPIEALHRGVGHLLAR
jgi:hypothetical protein